MALFTNKEKEGDALESCNDVSDVSDAPVFPTLVSWSLTWGRRE